MMSLRQAGSACVPRNAAARALSLLPASVRAPTACFPGRLGLPPQRRNLRGVLVRDPDKGQPERLP